MIEKALKLNGTSALAGIVTHPANLDPTRQPAIVLMNEGILHRIGASRLHVKVARMLAAQGCLCVRFDHAGIGDSGPRRGHQRFEEAAVDEVIDVMNHIQRTYGISQFIMYGLCSGADVGFDVAVRDARVVATIQLDAWIYPSVRSRLNQLANHYLPRLADPRVWFRHVTAKLRSLKAQPREDNREEWYADSDYIRKTPPKEQVESGLRTLVGRGVQMYICFSGGDYYGEYNYRGQYRDAFSTVRFNDLLQVDWLDSSTHLFTALEDQEQLMNAIAGWLGHTGLIAPRRSADYQAQRAQRATVLPVSTS